MVSIDDRLRKPLSQVELVVTRAAHQSHTLARRLSLLGAEVTLAPTIKLAPPPLPDDPIFAPGKWMIPSQEVGGQLSRFDWIIFTSVNAVHHSESAWGDRGGIRGALRVQASMTVDGPRGRPRVACVGTSTQSSLESLGVEVSLTPRAFHAESLLASLERERLKGERILIPRALKAREVLPAALRARGAEVWISPMYQTVGASIADEIKAKLISPRSDRSARVILFTSDSTVTRLLEQLDKEEQSSLRRNYEAWVIGPIVRVAAERAGFRVRGIAQPHTIDGLVEGLVSDFAAT